MGDDRADWATAWTSNSKQEIERMQKRGSDDSDDPTKQSTQSLTVGRESGLSPPNLRWGLLDVLWTLTRRKAKCPNSLTTSFSRYTSLDSYMRHPTDCT